MSHEQDFHQAEAAASAALDRGDYAAAARACEKAGRAAAQLRAATGEPVWQDEAQRFQNAHAGARDQARR